VNRGKLVALEGLDGCGKTTQLPHLARALGDAGLDVVATREPTDGEWGRKIRVMAQTGDLAPPEEELRWFMEDRQEHLQELILPALEAGRWVLTDRYFLSTVAYQGARGLDWREILRENEARFPAPDLALLFEVSPAQGLARVERRAGTPEPGFEQAEFLARVAEIFAAIERDWIARIDGSGSEDEVRRAALARLERILPSGGVG
jgi:dTMP kinase